MKESISTKKKGKKKKPLLPPIRLAECIIMPLSLHVALVISQTFLIFFFLVNIWLQPQSKRASLSPKKQSPSRSASRSWFPPISQLLLLLYFITVSSPLQNLTLRFLFFRWSPRGYPSVHSSDADEGSEQFLIGMHPGQLKFLKLLLCFWIFFISWTLLEVEFKLLIFRSYVVEDIVISILNTVPLGMILCCWRYYYRYTLRHDEDLHFCGDFNICCAIYWSDGASSVHVFSCFYQYFLGIIWLLLHSRDNFFIVW